MICLPVIEDIIILYLGTTGPMFGTGTRTRGAGREAVLVERSEVEVPEISAIRGEAMKLGRRRRREVGSES